MQNTDSCKENDTLYMSTIFDNSLLIKAINDECREFENAVKKRKNPVKDKEKNI